MSIEEDVALLERVPTLRLLGPDALRVLAIGCEQQEFARGALLFREGDAADCSFIVQSGSFRLKAEGSAQRTDPLGPGMIIDEIALLVPTQRSTTGIALEFSSVIRIARKLFHRVLESDPSAAVRLRDAMADRANMIADELSAVRNIFK